MSSNQLDSAAGVSTSGSINEIELTESVNLSREDEWREEKPVKKMCGCSFLHHIHCSRRLKSAESS
jgi:hypothetical protein